MENTNDFVESILIKANCQSSLIEKYQKLYEQDKTTINKLVKKIFFSHVTITDKIIEKFACKTDSIKTIKKIIECQVEFNRQNNKEHESNPEKKYEFIEEYHAFMDNIFSILLTGNFGHKDFFTVVINEYNKLPKSGQYDICVEVFNEFFSGGTLDLRTIVHTIHKKIKYYIDNNTDIEKLKQEEDIQEEASKVKMGNITVQADDLFRAMEESAKKVRSLPKIDFSGVRYEDGTENNETDALGISKTKK